MNNKESRLSKFLARKISKAKFETSGIAALSFGDLIYDTVRVDQRYLDGVDFSRPSKDLSSVFKIGEQNISDQATRGGDYLNILHERNYSGYTHEFVTHQYARNRGEEVIIPEKFNQKGYDAIYNGEKYQINLSNNLSLIAIQGPKAKDVLDSIVPGVTKLKFMNGNQFKYNDLDIYITRSGYTGEDGFEISIDNKIVEQI